MTELREEGVDLSEVSLAIFEECQIHSANQVWSLAQFYSVDLSPSEIRVNKCVHNKRTIKVCVSCFWRCPGTSMPSVAHLTVSLSLCRSGSNTWGESRALEGRSGSPKSPSRVRDNGEGVAGRNEREQYFPQRGVIDFPSRQINDFFCKKETEKNWISGHTWRHPTSWVTGAWTTWHKTTTPSAGSFQKFYATYCQKTKLP